MPPREASLLHHLHLSPTFQIPAPGQHATHFEAVPWEKYFKRSRTLTIRDVGEFRIYETETDGLSDDMVVPLLVLVHGGGFSSLTWSLFAAALVKTVKVRVLAYDMRGHGETKTVDDADLSISTLCSDLKAVITEAFLSSPWVHSDKSNVPVILMGHSLGGAVVSHTAHADDIRSLIGLIVVDVVEGTAIDALSVMETFLQTRPSSFRTLDNAIAWSVRSGHIMNAASAQVSMPGQLKLIDDRSSRRPSLKRLSSHHMTTISEEPNAPTSFVSDEARLSDADKIDAGDSTGIPVKRTASQASGIERSNSGSENTLPTSSPHLSPSGTHVSRKPFRRLDSIGEDEIAGGGGEQNKNHLVAAGPPPSATPVIRQVSSSSSDDDDSGNDLKRDDAVSHRHYTWRIDLMQTERFWQDWFRGLSKSFLENRAAKLLILAGMDRLDKELTIGQMQGKFQLICLPKSGHAVQEDQPDKVSDTVATFLTRNRFVQPCGKFQPIMPCC